MLIEQPSKNATEQDRIKAGISMVKTILTRCTGQIRYPDGTRKKIVDKHFDDSDDLTEISIEELDQADADKIVFEVQALSGLKEAGAKPKPFPESQGNGECPPACENLPQATD
jgi:hypothetical protein